MRAYAVFAAPRLKEVEVFSRRGGRHTTTYQSGRSTMNIPKILTPKAMTAYIGADDTVRQGLEVMRHHGYTAIPVLGEHGEYIGCITEGDFLWHILATGTTSQEPGAVPYPRPGEAGFLPAARHNRRRRGGNRLPDAAELRPHCGRPRLLLRHCHPPQRYSRHGRSRGRADRQGNLIEKTQPRRVIPRRGFCLFLRTQTQRAPVVK